MAPSASWNASWATRARSRRRLEQDLNVAHTKKTKVETKAETEVAVIGAGLSGLVAARELVRSGKEVLILEARNRVGGRTYTQYAEGVPLEMGGQWIGPAQERVLGLVREFGIETFPADAPGRTVLYECGARTEYEEETEAPPFRNPATHEEIERVFHRLSGLAKSVPAEEPWRAERAAEWDGQTLESWKKENDLGPGAEFYFDLAVESLYACEPRDLSLLGVLSDISAHGSFESLPDLEASAEEYRFVGGAQEISERLAKELGDRVSLDLPVSRLSQDSNTVSVKSGETTVEAEAVIVTVSPALRGRIRYEPDLPAAHDGLTQRMPMGAVIKCHAVYDTPFWRENGLNGRAKSDVGPCKLTTDNSPPDGEAGVLTGFILGRDAREWGRRPADGRRQTVLECFARYFGEEASTPLSYEELDWSEEPYSRGGYAGSPVPGALLDYGPMLREPFGRIHWAGAETSSEWSGYMEGAIRSGERAAKAVFNVLEEP